MYTIRNSPNYRCTATILHFIYCYCRVELLLFFHDSKCSSKHRRLHSHYNYHYFQFVVSDMAGNRYNSRFPV